MAAFAALSPSAARANPEGEEQEPMAARLGADLGLGALERRDYYLLNVTGLIRIYNFRADLWIPLRFFSSDFSFVSQDYDEVRDFTRIGRCLRVDIGDYAMPEDEYDSTCEAYRGEQSGIHDRLYFSARVSPLQGITLGHGSLMFNYRNSRDFERPQLGLHAEGLVYDWANLEFILDDVTRPNVIGGRIELRPPQLLFGENWDETPDDFVIGGSVVADIGAPLYRQTVFGRPLLDGAGNALFTRDTLVAVNADVHYTYYWGLSSQGNDGSDPQIGFMTFADYVGFPEVQDAHALHAGLRFLYRHNGWNLALGAEYRLTGNRYLPEYFDVEYVSRSQQFALTPELRSIAGIDPYITKYEYMLSRPGGFSQGVQAYGQVVIPIPNGGRRTSPFPIGVFFEEATGPANASVSFWAGPFQIDQLMLAGQYQRRNFNDLDQMFQPDGTLIRLLGRFYLGSSEAPEGSTAKLLANFHIDVRFDRRFFQTAIGDLAETNDFAVTLGFTAGS